MQLMEVFLLYYSLDGKGKESVQELLAIAAGCSRKRSIVVGRE
jgi:hypothetical protein